ncbi:MAG: alpha/beta hydrolase family protein [Acidimicrobiia bacterium]|nr:alpha/beta hydrolase family protein [Acidimicrobiia bacterium]
MHWLDRAAVKVIERGPSRLRFFKEGLGDPDELQWFQEQAATSWPIADIDVVWGNPTLRGGMVVTEGWFESPFVFLPDRARIARLRRIEPQDGAERCAVILAAWNDQNYRTRGKLATRLAEMGIASVMLENPYYGLRRPSPEPWQSIRTVVDLARMGRAVIEEGRALVTYFRNRLGYTMGITGYSMGGAHAAYVATTMPDPVAAAPLAPSHSPAAVFKGKALSVGVGLSSDHDTARFHRYLESVSLLNFEPPPHTAAAVLVAASDDGYVPEESARAIHEHWPGSKLVITGGGHASLLVARKPVLLRAIRDSFDRLHALERSQ